ncbi:MAG: hypothetical protein CO065_14680 [Comamonadaceae bacterium CG_4_9_14_0_8_um_filter_57_21]|nr:MAG: hypothetical protein CO065_14680 [Comamonadaceae bacterium CG_4_9_14_0_8_um_filter_57_21]
MTTFHQAAEVASELAARLATITVANGFHSDIGLRVLRGRRRIDDGQVPCAVLVEGADTPSSAPGALVTVEITQTYVLVAYHDCNPDHPNDKGHELIKDLKRAIFSDGTTLAKQVKRVHYRGRDIGPRGDGVGIVSATVEIDVVFVEDLTNP